MLMRWMWDESAKGRIGIYGKIKIRKGKYKIQNKKEDEDGV